MHSQAPNSGQNAPSTIQVAGVVGFYMGAALVMIFVNKAVLSGSPDLPLLFLLIQVLIAVGLLHASNAFTPRVVIPKLDMATARNLTPVVLVSVIGLIFNTLCLRDVEASFFQIARGLVLPLTIAVSSIYTSNLPSLRVLIAAAIVTFGFFVGVTPSSSVPSTASPSYLSLFYGVLSSIFIAVHAVLIKSSLQYCNNSTIELAYWTNAGSAVFILPFVFFRGELMTLRTLWVSPTWNVQLFVIGSLVTGVFGFLLCVASLVSIKVTSPTTHMFSSAARTVLQTLLGVWLNGDLLTTNRAASIGLISIGTMYYTWAKAQEGSSAPKPQPRPADLESGNRDGEATPMQTLWDAEEEDEKGVKGRD